MITKLRNGISYEINGWKYISIHGKPRERGYAYGYLCAKDFKEIQKMLKFFMMESYGQTWDFFINKISDDFKEMTERDFPEFYEEMIGITEGLNAAHCYTTIDEIIAWNFYLSISYWYSTISDSGSAREGGGSEKCSAFIAVGDWTEDGKIVCAHNSFADFIDGQFTNIALDIKPEKGHRMIMQTSPCWIWSGADFFITSKGIIGTETTIGGFYPYEKRYPIGYRIRQAMQYGNTLDEYCEILLHENSGDYANSWLFGDTNTNEILRIELGLNYHKIDRTKNGFFIGFNGVYDEQIRNLETKNPNYFYDIREHQGSRRVRLSNLMDKHKGKINIEIAKQIIGDHYDVYLNKDNNPTGRTVCSHYELDGAEYLTNSKITPYLPHGALDGIVCDTVLAKKMSFIGKYGSSCNIGFNKDEFCKKHIQYDKFCPYLKDRPVQPWTELTIYNYKNKFRLTKRQKNKNNKTKKN
jgi:hypothetical protein